MQCITCLFTDEELNTKEIKIQQYYNEDETTFEMCDVCVEDKIEEKETAIYYKLHQL